MNTTSTIDLHIIFQAHARDGNFEMQEVFALPEGERKRTVTTLRNKALARQNVLRIIDGEEPQRTRTQAMNKSKKGKVVMCSGCKQMVLSSCSHRHRKRCKENLKLEDKPSATELKVQKGSEDTIFKQKISEQHSWCKWPGWGISKIWSWYPHF